MTKQRIHYLFIDNGRRHTVCGVHVSCSIYIATENYSEVNCGNCKRKIEVYKYDIPSGPLRTKKFKKGSEC